jgi:hypothetical protein
MIRLAALLAMLAGQSAAETARVISGEHADFTRLVVELPVAADWKVGRTATGYAFAAIGVEQPGYDLSAIWDRIPRTRLQTLLVDPDNSALVLTLACDCHVFPFEYLPGTIVLDIRDGAAPVGSVFESAFLMEDIPPKRDLPPRVAAALPYDWLAWVRNPVRASAPARPSLPLEQDPGLLGPLREELLLQLSRGVADGVVDMALPGKPVETEAESMGDLAGALIRIGELPGLEVGDRSMTDGPEAAEEQCLADETVALPSWGDGRPPLDLLAEARAGLYGEFDTLSPDALTHAIKLHLYLGFGAEARQYATLMPGSGTDPAIRPLLSLARLIDGEADPTSPFAQMLGCDGPTALWAALAHDDLPTAGDVNADAIVRGFQALPPHLRHHLGPRLASMLMARDGDAARMIRDAVERTPDVRAGTVALIDSAADLHASRPDEARDHAEIAVLEGANGLAGLIALVEAHFQSGRSLSLEVAESLRAFRDFPPEQADQHKRALALALALAGHLDAAFALADPGDPVGADLWRIAASLAEDSPFLARAVVRPDDTRPSVDPDVALSIAVRLESLGFPEAALVWLGPVNAASSPDWRQAAARSELALGNAQAALKLLAGLAGPEVLELNATAHRQLGAYPAARQTLDSAGKTEESNRLAAWEANWNLLKKQGPSAWAKAASLLELEAGGQEGSLAESQAMLDESADARQAITALLAEVPSPPP